MSKDKKKVVLLGGAGVIGKVIIKKLSDLYEFIIIDKNNLITSDSEFIEADILQLQELSRKIPLDTDVLINLIAIEPQENIVEPNVMSNMVDIYIKGSYNIYLIASQLKIPKVIFASSNHVTDFYEKDGFSLLKREITVDDYPFTKSTYGALKLAGESIGHVFAINKDLSVICLRIGTVRLDEETALSSTSRFSRTFLYQDDVANLFKSAIEANIRFGIYYGVSNNNQKPWSIDNAIRDLSYKPQSTNTKFQEDNQNGLDNNS